MWVLVLVRSGYLGVLGMELEGAVGRARVLALMG
jgi:hypothetical protein